MENCRWVEPRLVVFLEFVEWTAANHLRHVKFVGMREDKAARAVGRESVRSEAKCQESGPDSRFSACRRIRPKLERPRSAIAASKQLGIGGIAATANGCGSWRF
jgi:ATP dependent DNA ligase C terminal region